MNSRGRLSLNYYTGPPTKHQNKKTDGSDPRPKINQKSKKEKEIRKKEGKVDCNNRGSGVSIARKIDAMCLLNQSG